MTSELERFTLSIRNIDGEKPEIYAQTDPMGNWVRYPALRAALDAAEARKPTVAEAARMQYIGFDFGGPGGDESCIVIRNPTPETLAALRAIDGGDA